MTQYLAQYNGLERNLSKGLEMSQKWTLLVITFEPLGVGGWNFAGWCAHGVGTFWLKFRVSTINTLRVIAVFVFLKTATKFALLVSMGTMGLCVPFEMEILKFNGWCYFWLDMSQCASKMLNLQQEMQWSWKEIILNQMNKIVLAFDCFDWDVVRCEAVDIYVFKLFNNFTNFDLCEQIWLYL